MPQIESPPFNAGDTWDEFHGWREWVRNFRPEAEWIFHDFICSFTNKVMRGLLTP